VATCATDDEKILDTFSMMHALHGDKTWDMVTDVGVIGQMSLIRTTSPVANCFHVMGRAKDLKEYAQLGDTYLTFSNPQPYNPGNALTSVKNTSTMVVGSRTIVDDKLSNTIRKLDITKNKPLKPVVRPTINGLLNPVTEAKAAIIAGAMEGAGHGMNQHRQNRFWSKEFEKNRRFGWLQSGHESRMENRNALEQLEMTFTGQSSLMAQQAGYDTQTLDQKAGYSKAVRDANLMTQGQVVGTNNASPYSSPQAHAASATTHLPLPGDAWDVVDIPLPGTEVDPSNKMIQGENNGIEDHYHPVNALQTDPMDLANPINASSAMNPYTESTKRI
jgi:hypothetical protein